MPELYQTDGNYEAYLSQLFNPLASGAQFNPGGLGAIGTGIGGLGAGTVPNMASLLQNPWGTPYPQQQSQLALATTAAIESVRSAEPGQASHADDPARASRAGPEAACPQSRDAVCDQHASPTRLRRRQHLRPDRPRASATVRARNAEPDRPSGPSNRCFSNRRFSSKCSSSRRCNRSPSISPRSSRHSSATDWPSNSKAPLDRDRFAVQRRTLLEER